MRAVTGSVDSSKPISLSKAATILSRFAANENAALPEVLAYVRRASAAFDELVHCHREIRAAQKRPELEKSMEKEERKKKRKKSSDDLVADQDGAATAREHGETKVNTNLTDGNMNSRRGGAKVESDREMKKKKRRKVNDEERSEHAETADKNVVKKARDYAEAAEFGEDGKRGKKKKEKMKHKGHREEEGRVKVLEEKHKTDLDAREELEQSKDQKEQRKKKKKKNERRED